MSMRTHSTFLSPRRALSRRTVLRGMGASLALPLLDAMVPALTPTVLTAHAAAPPRRASTSRTARSWTAGHLPRPGAGFELSPILAPMAPFKSQMTVVTNLARPEKRATTPTTRARRRRGWPACRRSAPTGPDFSLATTLDQVVASTIGQDTTFPSIEIASNT